MRPYKEKATYYILALILINILWYLASLVLKSDAVVNPIRVYIQLVHTFNHTMIINIGASLYRVLVSVLMSTILGVFMAVLIKAKPKIGKVMNPMVYLLYPIPKTALLPVIIAIQKIGELSKITLIILITVFQVIIYTKDALDTVKPAYYNPLITLGATKTQLLHQVSIPAILPSLFSSLRISVATAFSILFFVEAMGTQRGLGYYIQDHWSKINYLDMWVGIVWISGLCLALFLLIEVIEKRMVKG